MKINLRHICASFLILISGMISAQPASQNEQPECITVNVDYSMELSEGAVLKGNATVTVQDKAFRMRGNGIEAYCDGISIWMLDSEAREVYIEAADSASESYMQNPAELVESLKDRTEGTYVLSDGKKIHIKVNSIKKSDGKDIASFRPTQNFDSSWVITDLR